VLTKLNQFKKEILYTVVGDTKKIVGREVVVFDIDGVLVDSSERYMASLMDTDPSVKDHNELPVHKKAIFWNTFLSEKYMELDRPIPKAIEVLKMKRERFPLVILTGRTSNMLSGTLKQLREFGVEFDVLIMRYLGVYMKDADFKEHVIKSLGLNVAEVHDDSLDIISVLHKYVTHGSFYWYKPGNYIYVPPVIITVNGTRYTVNDENSIKMALENIDKSANPLVEVRYGNYVATVSKHIAKSVILALHHTLPREIHEHIYASVQANHFARVKVFGEDHPSLNDADIDKILQLLL